MRIWDINPGYLNRQSLLGEHRELHGIVSIIVNNKKGYSKHPETIRWINYGWALRMRHQLLAAEMSLRNFTEKSPVATCKNKGMWPEKYIDEPVQQFIILNEKYQKKEQGRIPLPKTAQELWRQHKYSILARDVNLYKILGKQVSQMSPNDDFSSLTLVLVEQLKVSPSIGGIRNTLQHMWGYVSDYASTSKCNIERWSLEELLNEIQYRVLTNQESYLLSSTALSELKVWLEFWGHNT